MVDGYIPPKRRKDNKGHQRLKVGVNGGPQLIGIGLAGTLARPRLADGSSARVLVDERLLQLKQRAQQLLGLRCALGCGRVAEQTGSPLRQAVGQQQRAVQPNARVHQPVPHGQLVAGIPALGRVLLHPMRQSLHLRSLLALHRCKRRCHVLHEKI